MNITKYAIENPIVTYTLTFFAIIGGIAAYLGLGRLENPEYTIKEVIISTQYPGATALEVEEEVTDTLETAIQQLKQLDKIWSESRPGLSIIHAQMKDKFDKNSLPQVWDELRKKINDTVPELPPSCLAPSINDDYGDVYGVYFALTGDGYTKKELYDYAKLLKKQLLLCKNVAKVNINGYTTEVIYLEFNRSKMTQLGITPQTIFNAINTQNEVGSGGSINYKGDYITINTTGSFDSIDAISNLLIRGTDAEKLTRVGDIVNIRRDYNEPALTIMEYNGKPSIGIGISTIPGTNVVVMGDAVDKKLEELQDQTPVGMNLFPIYFQSKIVKESVNGFVVNLVEAVVIVVILLLIFMGRHEGVIIGLILLVTILITFVGMSYFEVNLQRISLGALIIALGMLVDNAIVVCEGIVIKMQRGIEKTQAAVQTVDETKWPLLGATIIAIIAFSAISLSQDSSGEFMGSLFTVIALSLLISWLTAITLTPLLCVQLITKKDAADKDPHDNLFFKSYAKILKVCINHRYIVIILMLALLIVSGYCFKFIDQTFFPSSTSNIFLVDLWMKEGSHIDKTEKTAKAIAADLLKEEKVTETVTFVGSGGQRFTLTYAPESMTSAYAQIMIFTDKYESIDGLIPKVRTLISEKYPEVETKIKKMDIGPSAKSKIEARFIGPDSTVLHDLGNQAKEIFAKHAREEGTITFIHDDWRQPVESIEINIAEARARNAGITRPDINSAIAGTFTGQPIGFFREKDELLPIIVRSTKMERDNLRDLRDIMVWSSVHGKPVPLTQVADGASIKWQDSIIRRRNRQRCLTAQCEPANNISATVLFNSIQKEIEAIELPTGYKLDWGGEYEKSKDAREKLLGKFPLALAAMFTISLLLFKTLRHPIIIFLGLPLSIIGITWGLLAFNASFSFTALLGLLSLTGMLIKNEIVLLEQINLERDLGKEPFTAIIEASISRVRPVAMAAFTTVLGMMPLMFDPFFQSLSVTIMGGLTFATILTLIFVPTIYATLFRIKEKK